MTKLQAFIPIDRRFALSTGADLPDRTHGTALFADISGFTPLTEALKRSSTTSTPSLTSSFMTYIYINPVFDIFIHDLHQHGGSVIGFASDAVTCWEIQPTFAPAHSA